MAGLAGALGIPLAPSAESAFARKTEIDFARRGAESAFERMGGTALDRPGESAARLQESAVATPVRAKLTTPITFFSKHLQWLDFEGMARTAAEMGFDGIDLTVRPGGHVLPERVEDDLPRAVDRVREAGIDVYSIVTGVTDPDDLHTEPILRTAGGLGIPVYRLGYWRYDVDRSIPAQLDALRPVARDLAAMNAEYGICGEYQNHAGTSYVGASIWDLWTLFEGLDPAWMGCQFDVRHATVEGGTTWPVMLRLMTSRIHTVVAKDFLWSRTSDGWRIRDTPLGEGMVAFEPYLETLHGLGFSGSVILHCEYPLGGANDGARTLGIPEGLFRRRVEADLALLTHWLDRAGFGG